jgi:hypothetical protein
VCPSLPGLASATAVPSNTRKSPYTTSPSVNQTNSQCRSACRLRGTLIVVQPIDKLLALRITNTSLSVTTVLDNVTSSSLTLHYHYSTLTLHYCSPPYSFISKEIHSSRYSDCVCIRRTEIRFPAGSRDSPLLRNVQTASGTHPDFHPVYSGSSIHGRGCKAVGA